MRDSWPSLVLWWLCAAGVRAVLDWGGDGMVTDLWRHDTTWDHMGGPPWFLRLLVWGFWWAMSALMAIPIWLLLLFAGFVAWEKLHGRGP